MIEVKGVAQAGFHDAVENAISQAPPVGNIPREYEILKQWIQRGGVVGTLYYVSVRVTGQDVP